MTTKNLVPRNNSEGKLGIKGEVNLNWKEVNAISGSFNKVNSDILKNQSDADLLIAGSNVTITHSNNQYQISSTGGGSSTLDKIEEGQSKVETIDTGIDARIEFWADPNDDGTSTKIWEFSEDGHLIPAVNDTFDIGSAELKVRDLYLGANSIKMGENQLSISIDNSNNLLFDGAQLLTNASIAPVATSGSYTDLSDKPSIPSASTDLSDSSDLARLASPGLTGNPTSPTPVSGDNSTSIATTAFVQSELAIAGGVTTLNGLTDASVSDPNGGEVLKYDSSTSAFVNTTPHSIKRISSTSYTLTSDDIASGVYIVYTGSSTEFTVTLSDPSLLIDENNVVNSDVSKMCKINIGRDILGDIKLYSSSSNILLLGDVSGNYSSQRTIKSSQFIEVIGFSDNDNGYWITSDGDKQIDQFVTVTAGSNINLYGGEFVNIKSGVSVGYTCTIRGTGKEAASIQINNNSNITVTVSPYQTNVTINGTNGSISLSPGKSLTLYCDTGAAPDDWISVNSTQGTSSLDNLSDVTISNPANRQVLLYSNSSFVNDQLDYSDLSGTPTLGTVSSLDWGTNANEVVRLDGTGKLPAVDGSQLTNLALSGGSFDYLAITADPSDAVLGTHYSCTGTFTITLPNTGDAGKEIRIKNMGSGTITIDPGTNTIDGSSTNYELDVQYSSITLVSTGSNWEII